MRTCARAAPSCSGTQPVTWYCTRSPTFTVWSPSRCRAGDERELHADPQIEGLGPLVSKTVSTNSRLQVVELVVEVVEGRGAALVGEVVCPIAKRS